MIHQIWFLVIANRYEFCPLTCVLSITWILISSSRYRKNRLLYNKNNPKVNQEKILNTSDKWWTISMKKWPSIHVIQSNLLYTYTCTYFDHLSLLLAAHWRSNVDHSQHQSRTYRLKITTKKSLMCAHSSHVYQFI